MENFNSFSSDQIILTKRQVSMIMASMLLFCLFVFIVGFFLGKRTVIEDFSTNVTKEALNDQIDFLLTTQSLQNSQEESDIEISDSEKVIDKVENLFSMPSIEQDLLTTFAHDKTVELEKSAMPVVQVEEKKTSADLHQSMQEKDQKIIQDQNFTDDLCPTGIQSKKQYAQLIGFGTKKAAQTFVARLKKHDVPVLLKTVISKTASGKQRTWYQAVTPTYESCKELQDHIAKIKRLEHIRDKDIKIVHVK